MQIPEPDRNEAEIAFDIAMSKTHVLLTTMENTIVALRSRTADYDWKNAKELAHALSKATIALRVGYSLLENGHRKGEPR